MKRVRTNSLRYPDKDAPSANGMSAPKITVARDVTPKMSAKERQRIAALIDCLKEDLKELNRKKEAKEYLTNYFEHKLRY